MSMKDFYISGNTLIKYVGEESDVVVPNGVKIIGRQAFTCRDTLLSVVLPEGVVTIGEQAFDSCYHLKSIVIPSTVTRIEKNAFASCRMLDSVKIPLGVPAIASRTFIGCFSLKEVIIPESVTAIGEYAFSRCYSLTEIDVGDNVTDIGEDAFSYCRSLLSVALGKGIEKIQWNTFASCEALKTVSLSRGLHEIVYAAFDGCNALSHVNYSGTEEEWRQIVISHTKNTTLLSATISYETGRPLTVPPVNKQDKSPAASQQISFDLIGAVGNGKTEPAGKTDEPTTVPQTEHGVEADQTVAPKTELSLFDILEETPAVAEDLPTAKTPVEQAPAPQPEPQSAANETPAANQTPAVSDSVKETPAGRPALRRPIRTAQPGADEVFKQRFYADFAAKIDPALKARESERAANMTESEFETLSEALFLVPPDDAYAFGCMCLLMKRYNWAFRAFLSAAGKGNLPSQFYVGCCFLWGIDTSRKIVDAARWLTKCKNDPIFGAEATSALAIVDSELEKPENAGLKVKRGNK